MKNISNLRQKTKYLKASNTYACFHTVYDISLIMFSIFLSLSSNTIFWALGQVILFIHIWRSFSILHSCAHNSFFLNRKLNIVVGCFFSIFAFVPFEDWKKAHVLHHKWVGDRKNDPSLCLPHVESISDKTKTVLDLCWKLHLPIFSFIVILIKIFEKKEKKEKKEKLSTSIIFIILSHLLLLFLMGFEYFKVFTIPFLGYLFTSDLIIISQHNMVGENHGRRFPLKMLEHQEVTRDLQFPSFISRYVLLEFDKHNLHHVFPSLPHYKLSHIDDQAFDFHPKKNWLIWFR